MAALSNWSQKPAVLGVSLQKRAAMQWHKYPETLCLRILMLSFLLIMTDDVNSKNGYSLPKSIWILFFFLSTYRPDVHLYVSVILWILPAEEISSVHVSILLYKPSANEVASVPAHSCAWGNAIRSPCPPLSSFSARVLLFKQWYSGGWGQHSHHPPIPLLPPRSVSLQHICKKHFKHQMGEVFVDNNNAYTSKNCTCSIFCPFWHQSCFRCSFILPVE